MKTVVFWWIKSGSWIPGADVGIETGKLATGHAKRVSNKTGEPASLFFKKYFCAVCISFTKAKKVTIIQACGITGKRVKLKKISHGPIVKFDIQAISFKRYGFSTQNKLITKSRRDAFIRGQP